MREIISTLLEWKKDGKQFALAKVVGTEGSSPREIGATMAVNEDGVVAGSVSGGCVEGAVVSESLAAMGATDAVLSSVGVIDKKIEQVGDARTLTYGYSDDEAFAVGLTCGGTLHIMIQPQPPAFLEEIARLLYSDSAFVLVTVFGASTEVEDTGEFFNDMNRGVSLPLVGSSFLVRSDGSYLGTLGNEALDRVILRDALGALSGGVSNRRHYGRSGQSRAQEISVLFEVYSQPPKMVIFGAVDFTAALAKAARGLGYYVVVCDARPVFATPERFPMANEVVVDWPDRYLEKEIDHYGPRDSICVLTHDPKFDVPAIVTALKTKAGYIGAMGSRRTHDERTARLIEAGVDSADLTERVAGPIGLDIGARTPEETAISILGEIIAKREGKVAPFLSFSHGRIHGDIQTGLSQGETAN